MHNLARQSQLPALQLNINCEETIQELLLRIEKLEKKVERLSCELNVTKRVSALLSSSMGNWGGRAKTKNEKLEISSFKKYRVLKKVICKYF